MFIGITHCIREDDFKKNIFEQIHTQRKHDKAQEERKRQTVQAFAETVIYSVVINAAAQIALNKIDQRFFAQSQDASQRLTLLQLSTMLVVLEEVNPHVQMMIHSASKEFHHENPPLHKLAVLLGVMLLKITPMLYNYTLETLESLIKIEYI